MRRQVSQWRLEVTPVSLHGLAKDRLACLAGVDGSTTPLILAIRAILRIAVRDKLTLARQRPDYKRKWRGAM